MTFSLSNPRKLLTFILFVFAIVTPASLVIFVILRFGVDVPYWDDWAFVSLLERIHAGKLSIRDLLAQHNEHRMIFPRLVKLGLTHFTGWNTFYELFASWTFIALSFFALWNLLQITLGEHLNEKIRPLVVVNGLLLFSLAQGENFIWGWQLQWFLAEFFTILSIWALARWKGRWIGVLLAAFFTFVTQYSIASGQFLWSLGLLVMIVERKKWKLSQILFWSITATALICVYFYHFDTENRNLFTFIEKPLGFIEFILGCLGSAFGTFGPFGGLNACIVYGTLGMIVFTGSSAFLWRRCRQWWINMLPWMQFALYGLLGVVVTAVGRMQYGVAYHALVSRYSIFALFFWIGTLVNLTVCMDVLAENGYLSKLRIRVALTLFVILLAWGHVNTSIGRYEALDEFRHRTRIAQSAMYDYRMASDGDLKITCYLDPNELRRRAAFLESLRLGPYKRGTGPEIVAQLNHNWLEEVQRLNLVSSVVRANLIYIVPGDIDESKQQGKVLKFTVETRGGVHCFLGSKMLTQQNDHHAAGSRILVFESKNASYMQIFWNRNEKPQPVSLYAEPLTNKWKAFRVKVPTRVRGYSFALFYNEDPPIKDKVKVSVYERLSSSTSTE